MALPVAPGPLAAGGGLATALDLLMVFDVTGSMGPCIYQVRRELDRLTHELFGHLPALGVSVRLGVIAVADYDARPYVTRHLDFAETEAVVRAFVTSVEGSSGAWNEGEAYEAALHLAGTLSWRPDAAKVLVLAGDDLPHPPGFRGAPAAYDWRAEARSLAARGVVPYAVQCPSGRGIARSAHFYRELAATAAGGAHLQLHQFANITDVLLALVSHARGDVAGLARLEEEMMAAPGRYNRGMEQTFNALLGRADAGRAALAVGGAGGGAAAGGAGGGAGRVPVAPGRFQRMTVDHDMDIRGFVQATGAAFAAGNGFYEITKPEDVSAKKEVILEHLASGEMFSGNDARYMLGLRPGVDGKVRPASVPAGYRAFVQSTSYNRKLIGGTQFLYEIADPI